MRSTELQIIYKNNEICDKIDSADENGIREIKQILLSQYRHFPDVGENLVRCNARKASLEEAQKASTRKLLVAVLLALTVVAIGAIIFISIKQENERQLKYNEAIEPQP